MRLFDTVYNVICAPDTNELVYQINIFLDNGWSLQGGASYIKVPSGGVRRESDIWIQAIYKKRFRWIKH
jgi:hypothetical protein